MRLKELAYWDWNLENFWVGEAEKPIKEWEAWLESLQEELEEQDVKEISG